EGRTADLTVSMGPRRADGAFGSVGSTRVTVSYGVGRYSFEVSAGDLFANVDGDKATWSRGGVRMMRVPVEQQEERELNIVVTTRVVSARAEECRFAGEEGHNAEGTGPECDGECVSLDGDVRELSSPEESVITADADDLEAFEGDAVAWAVDFIRTKTDAAQPSSSPIGDAVRECEWLSGDYADPHEGDARVTEVSVRLTGDWSEEERARVFVGVVRG
ncbi:hypothetical protein, partial [Streptomyces griseoaurantiacus]|uniref:hypothetical protein n=1 Tax=Streptomyces griseoaurantiacus TaxID=68213 RepID=UPI003698B0D2